MILKFLRYLLHDYAMKEKEEFDRIEEVLRKGKVNNKEKKSLEELANWHFENYMEAAKEGGIPWCVQQYLFGYRSKRPEPREIYQEYLGNAEYWRGMKVQKSRIYKAIALGVGLVVLLVVLVTFLKG